MPNLNRPGHPGGTPPKAQACHLRVVGGSPSPRRNVMVTDVDRPLALEVTIYTEAEWGNLAEDGRPTKWKYFPDMGLYLAQRTFEYGWTGDAQPDR